MAAYAGDVDFRPVLPRRNNYRRLYMEATKDRVSLLHQIRELRHEVKNLETALAWTATELEKRA
jgi:hypothetical protein